MALDAGSRHANNRKEVEESLADLDKRVDRLRVLYEQYFMGIQRTEPYTVRTDVNRRILELAKLNLRNTALRYRFNAIRQRVSTYSAYWGRTMRAVENGSYVRNVAKVGRDAIRRGLDVPDEILRAMPPRMRERLVEQRRQQKDALAKAAPDANEEKVETKRTATGAIQFDDDDLNTAFDGEFDKIMADVADNEVLTPKAPVLAKPAPVPDPDLVPGAARPVPGKPKAKPNPKPVLKLPPGMDEAAARKLFASYVQAKRMVGQDTSGLRYEQIVRTISKQAPKIMRQHNAKGVQFEVAIKNNKVILKAIPKRN